MSGHRSRRGSLGRQLTTSLCCATALVLGVAPATGQETNKIDTQIRVKYQYQQLVKERIRAFGMVRYDELLGSDAVLGKWNQLATSGGVSYDLSPRVRLEGALSLYYNWRPLVEDLFEVRLWQAVTLDWPDSLGKWRRFFFSHRLMLEERFSRTTDWEFAARLRYRLATTYPINRYSLEPGAFYAPLSVELFATPGEDTQELFSEQARVTAGLGYVLNKTWSVELRYTRQRSRDTITDDVRTTDNIIELRFRTSIRIRDLLKSR